MKQLDVDLSPAANTMGLVRLALARVTFNLDQGNPLIHIISNLGPVTDWQTEKDA